VLYFIIISLMARRLNIKDFKPEINLAFAFLRTQDSMVGTVNGYTFDDQGVGVFSSPCHPNQLWGPHSLLSNGYLNGHQYY
jgi:hypothetical protein